MLHQAKQRLAVPLVQEVAEQLPFRDAVFDFLSVGYVLRHVADVRDTFGEYFRMRRPGGTVLVLDFARPRSRPALGLGRLYLDRVVPWLSRVASGSAQAKRLMHYCWETVETLPPPEHIGVAMTACGFREARWRIVFGLLSEYVARKQ